MNVKTISKVSIVNKSENPSITLTRTIGTKKSEAIKSEPDVSEKESKKMVEEINKLLEQEKIHAEYSVHEGFGDIIIKIVDNETKQVVKEFPKEKVIDMVRKLCDIAGILVDQKV